MILELLLISTQCAMPAALHGRPRREGTIPCRKRTCRCSKAAAVANCAVAALRGAKALQTSQQRRGAAWRGAKATNSSWLSPEMLWSLLAESRRTNKASINTTPPPLRRRNISLPDDRKLFDMSLPGDFDACTTINGLDEVISKAFNQKDIWLMCISESSKVFCRSNLLLCNFWASIGVLLLWKTTLFIILLGSSRCAGTP